MTHSLTAATARVLALLALLCGVLAPAAHGQALTDHAENRVVDALFRAQALSAPATWWVALYTTSCSDTGGGTEVSGGSYARASLGRIAVERKPCADHRDHRELGVPGAFVAELQWRTDGDVAVVQRLKST